MELTGNVFAFPWEVSLMEGLQSTLGPGVIQFVSWLSAFGEELFLILLLGFLFWCYDKKMAKSIGLTLVMSVVWMASIENIALRRRPYFDHEGIKIYRVVEPSADPLDISAQGYSFPSGHSAQAAGVFGGMAAYTKNKILIALAFVIPLLVGISRVVVGAHFPTDVLAGWVLGAFSLFVVQRLEKAVKNRWVFYSILLATALPGLFFCKSEDFFSGFGLLVGFIAGVELEEKFVKFEGTRHPVRCALRVAGGVAVFFALNALLKLPFPKDFLNGNSYPALLVRSARYAVIAIADFCVYPFCFRFFDRFWAKK